MRPKSVMSGIEEITARVKFHTVVVRVPCSMADMLQAASSGEILRNCTREVLVTVTKPCLKRLN